MRPDKMPTTKQLAAVEVSYLSSIRALELAIERNPRREVRAERSSLIDELRSKALTAYDRYKDALQGTPELAYLESLVRIYEPLNLKDQGR